MTAAWTTPAKTWVTGDPIPASDLNTHVRDNNDYLEQEVVAKLGQWTSYVPTLTQTATISKTTNYARYVKFGRMVIANVHLTATSAGSAGVAITIGLPVTSRAFAGTPIIGNGWVYDATGVIGYSGALLLTSTTSAQVWADDQANTVGISPSFALANNDQIGIFAMYESAA